MYLPSATQAMLATTQNTRKKAYNFNIFFLSTYEVNLWRFFQSRTRTRLTIYFLSSMIFFFFINWYFTLLVGLCVPCSRWLPHAQPVLLLALIQNSRNDSASQTFQHCRASCLLQPLVLLLHAFTEKCLVNGHFEAIHCPLLCYLHKYDPHYLHSANLYYRSGQMGGWGRWRNL